MRGLVTAIALGAVIASAGIAGAVPPEDVKAYCAGKWPDYTMQVVCVDQEEAARGRLSRGISDREIWDRCWYRSDSWNKVDSCVNREEQAKARLQEQRAPASPPSPSSPSVPPVSSAPPTSPPPPPRPQGDRAAITACETFGRTYRRFQDGVIGVRDIASHMRTVYASAERSTDPQVREAAGLLVRTTDLSRQALTNPRPGDPPLSEALHRFGELCATRVLAPALPPKETRPITEAEADRELKGVLERSGATDAKCTKKQYGPGWVTVCE